MRSYKRSRELLRDIPFYNVCLKNISRDNAIQKAIICQFWPVFLVPPEEIRSVPGCKRTREPRKRGHFQTTTTKDHHPQVISITLNSKKNMKNCECEITSERENFWDITFCNFCLKKISRDNAIQKAIICQFWLIFFFSRTRRDPQCNRLQTNK